MRLPGLENTFLSLMKRYTAFRDEITFQMASDSPSLFPVLSLTLPSSPTLHLTCPCECSIYCNCIQHLALQTADKAAQGQLPTLTVFINRLFAQAYQSPYPQSMCGCLWTFCSSYRNRSPLLCEGGIGPPARSVRDQFVQREKKKHCCVVVEN